MVWWYDIKIIRKFMNITVKAIHLIMSIIPVDTNTTVIITTAAGQLCESMESLSDAINLKSYMLEKN